VDFVFLEVTQRTLCCSVCDRQLESGGTRTSA